MGSDAGVCLCSALLYLTSSQSVGSEFAVVRKSWSHFYFPQNNLVFSFFLKVVLEILVKVHCILNLLMSVTVTVMSITEFLMASTNAFYIN